MSCVRRGVSRALGACAVAVVGAGVAAAGVPAHAADDADHPRVVALSEFTQYWEPKPYDKANPAGTAWRGTVKPAGEKVLARNDALIQEINKAGAADEKQAHRALIDADSGWRQTLPDALGPTLGKYFAQGLSSGRLPKTAAALDAANHLGKTSPAKQYFNYPRPYFEDRSFGGDSKLGPLKKNLGLQKIPTWRDPDTGLVHSGGYDALVVAHSQAFPSGHTTHAYTAGIGLAMLLPELGPEALARSSEAGNNRIVLGVHYPLDVIGGRILGHMNSAQAYIEEDWVNKHFKPARAELERYLTDTCKKNGKGTTLSACIDAVDADNAGGYKNAFTDAITAVPVTDRATALRAYRARMTYGFEPKSAARTSDVALPKGAEVLLATAYPTLSAEGRREVLRYTAIEPGHIFATSSAGWQRINLAAAMTARVTVDKQGRVLDIDTGEERPSVVVEGASAPKPVPTHTPTQAPKPTHTPKPTPTSEPAAGSSDHLPRTGGIVGLGAGIAALAAGTGLVLASRRRSR